MINMSGKLWKWYLCMLVEMAMPLLAISIHPPITGATYHWGQTPMIGF